MFYYGEKTSIHHQLTWPQNKVYHKRKERHFSSTCSATVSRQRKPFRLQGIEWIARKACLSDKLLLCHGELIFYKISQIFFCRKGFRPSSASTEKMRKEKKKTKETYKKKKGGLLEVKTE